MFTIKMRSYNLSPRQEAAGYPCFDDVESIHGPFGAISKELDKDTGTVVVYGLSAGGGIEMTFGPYNPNVGQDEDAPKQSAQPPRPTVWVMNDHGATIAKYDL